MTVRVNLFVGTLFLTQTCWWHERRSFHVEAIGGWHMYNSSFVPSASCQEKYYNQADFLKPQQLAPDNKWGLWPDLTRQRDVEDGEVLFGFYEAMDILYNHQHPKDCQDVKFLVSAGYGAGYGSQVHIEGQGLQAALDSGRVYLRHPGSPTKLRHFFGWQTDTDFCRTQGTNTLDCWYRPWSSCTLAGRMKGMEWDGVERWIRHGVG